MPMLPPSIRIRARNAVPWLRMWCGKPESANRLSGTNACDCHHHIYDARYPIDPKAVLRPGDALVDDYRAFQKRIGTSRNVVVQPSASPFRHRSAPTLTRSLNE